MDDYVIDRIMSRSILVGTICTLNTWIDRSTYIMSTLIRGELLLGFP